MPKKKNLSYFRQNVLSPSQVRTEKVTVLRKEYQVLAKEYLRFADADYVYCHKCDRYHGADDYSPDSRFASGLFPICRECLRKMTVNINTSTGDMVPDIKGMQEVCNMLNVPYIEGLATSVIKECTNDAGTLDRIPLNEYLHTIKTDPHYKKMEYKDSLFAAYQDFATEDENLDTIKMFGDGFTPDDYDFLSEQYSEWREQFPAVDNDKSLKELIKRVCFKQLDILKAQRAGKDTTNLDRSFQDLLGSASLKPTQNKDNIWGESQTFGTLIDLWEQEKPIPEPQEEFKDPDKIGLLIDVFFKGHTARMLNLKNSLSNIYTRYMEKYTVHKPQRHEEEDSEKIFEEIFGSLDDE